MQPLTEFLTPEECLEVDTALLSSKEKFSARLAIYGLRALKQISGETGEAIASVTHQQVMDWIEQDERIKQQIEVDRSFETFFTKLVIASMKPLKQISSEAGVPIEDLTLKQVVAWFEKDGKVRREQGNDAAFLEL